MPGEPLVVYIDVYLLVNFAVDLVLLWACGRLAGESRRLSSLVLGAGLGSLYAGLCVVAGWPVLSSWPVVIAVSLLMVYATYPVPWVRFARLVAWYYAAGFIVAGAAVAASSVGVSELVWWARGFIPASTLVLGLVVAGVIVRLLSRLWAQRRLGPVFVDAEVHVQGRTCTVRALVDSGNQLKDPHTKLPVMVVEREAVRALMPAGSLPDFMAGVVDTPGPHWEEGGRPFPLRLVPYRSLGRQGLLVGFRPDYVILTGPDGPRMRSDIVIGIYDERLSQDGSYSALLPAGLASDA